MFNPLAEIEVSTHIISRNNPDEIANVLVKMEWIKQKVREVEAKLKQRLVEIIQETGPITIGPIRYYVGTPSLFQCTDKPGTIAALLDATDGDFDALATYLVVQPFKHGACREILSAEQFDRLFTVTPKDRLKEGKPTKQLLKSDERFNRPRRVPGQANELERSE